MAAIAEYKIYAANFPTSRLFLFYLYSTKDYSDYANVKFFYVRRLLKIYPLYILHTIVWCLLYQQFYPSVLPSIVLGISSFSPTLFGKMGIGGTWFVSVIFFCYFCFPVLCSFIKNKNNLNLNYNRKMKVASRGEIEIGKATCLSGIDGKVKEYELEIEKIYLNNNYDNKSMVIKITDTNMFRRT